MVEFNRASQEVMYLTGTSRAIQYLLLPQRVAFGEVDCTLESGSVAIVDVRRQLHTHGESMCRHLLCGSDRRHGQDHSGGEGYADQLDRAEAGDIACRNLSASFHGKFPMVQTNRRLAIGSACRNNLSDVGVLVVGQGSVPAALFSVFLALGSDERSEIRVACFEQ